MSVKKQNLPLIRGLITVAVLCGLLLPLTGVWLPTTSNSVDTNETRSEIPVVLLLQTVVVALVSAAIAVAAGFVFAGIFSLTGFSATPFTAALMLLPFICPSTVWSLMQSYAYGRGGMLERLFGDETRPLLSVLNKGGYFATVLVLAQIHMPITMLIIARGMMSLHEAGFEAACLYLRPLHFLMWLTRALRAELSASFLLAGSLSMGNLAVPHVLQCRLYSVELYLRMSSSLDHQAAIRAAFPLLAISMLMASVVGWLWLPAGRLPVLRPPIRLRLGNWRYSAYGSVFGYLGMTIVIPIASLIMECDSPDKFLDAIRDAKPETINTLMIAAGTATVASVAGVLVIAGASGVLRRIIHVLAAAPLGIPSLFTGLAFARFFNQAYPFRLSSLGDTSALVILGLAFRSWPFSARLISLGHSQFVNRWHDAMEVSGLNQWIRFRRIWLPAMLEHISAAALVAFIIAAGDVETTQLLCAPGQGTLSLRLFTFLHFGPTHVAASLALLQLLLVLIPASIYCATFMRLPKIM